MPRLGNIETVRQIRSDDKLKHIPVAILTNSSLEEDKKAVLSAGADIFLHKSGNLDQFCKDLKKFLNSDYKYSLYDAYALPLKII